MCSAISLVAAFYVMLITLIRYQQTVKVQVESNPHQRASVNPYFEALVKKQELYLTEYQKMKPYLIQSNRIQPYYIITLLKPKTIKFRYIFVFTLSVHTQTKFD